MAKGKMSTGLCSFLEDLEENPFPHLSYFLEVSVVLGSRPLPPSSKLARLGLCFLSHCSLSASLFSACLFHLKGPCDCIGPAWVIQDHLSIFRSADEQPEFPFAM